MKTAILILMCLLATKASAQRNYEKNMTEAMTLWRSGQAQQAAAKLESIAQAAKDNWIPAYYQAMVLTTAAFTEQDQELRVKYVEASEAILDDSKQDNNAEWLVLRAMNKTAFMLTDPMTKGKELAPIIIGYYQKALAIAPNNPRARLGIAEFQLNSKKYFNQDISQECEDVRKALSLFDEEKVTIPFAPSWGRDRAVQILKECK